MIHSELIPSLATEESTQAILSEIGLNQPQGAVGYMVFRVQFDDKEFLCCWAGGSLADGRLSLTPIGIGALEALSRVEAVSREGIDVYGLNADSAEALAAQVEATLTRLPDRSRICFVGDVAGKLRTWLPTVFNVRNWEQVVNG